jgi:hypothetical protein
MGVVGGHPAVDAGQPQPRHQAGADDPQVRPRDGPPLPGGHPAGLRHPGQRRPRVRGFARRRVHRWLLLARLSGPLGDATHEYRVLDRQDRREPRPRHTGEPPARGGGLDGRPGLGARGSTTRRHEDQGRRAGRSRRRVTMRVRRRGPRRAWGPATPPVALAATGLPRGGDRIVVTSRSRGRLLVSAWPEYGRSGSSAGGQVKLIPVPLVTTACRFTALEFRARGLLLTAPDRTRVPAAAFGGSFLGALIFFVHPSAPSPRRRMDLPVGAGWIRTRGSGAWMIRANPFVSYVACRTPLSRCVRGRFHATVIDDGDR